VPDSGGSGRRLTKRAWIRYAALCDPGLKRRKVGVVVLRKGDEQVFVGAAEASFVRSLRSSQAASDSNGDGDRDISKTASQVLLSIIADSEEKGAADAE
jgi:hypothetical protein